MKTLENANNSGGEEKCLCQCSIALVLDHEELPQILCHEGKPDQKMFLASCLPLFPRCRAFYSDFAASSLATSIPRGVNRIASEIRPRIFSRLSERLSDVRAAFAFSGCTAASSTTSHLFA
jgi:hypothetical protein